ncbi:MAG: hypothetical protein Q7S92_04685 [Candidatus Diapherotrites archaeon]|nr:hypothetical protein [Candidatus Diapherotrites archaeon]
MGRKLLFIEKMAIFLISVIVTVFVLVSFKVWSHDLTTYFFKAGKWPELIVVFGIAYVITWIVEQLLKWQARKLDHLPMYKTRRKR